MTEKILWKTSDAAFEKEELLLQDRDSQILLTPDEPVIIRNEGTVPGILLDFGTELHGGCILVIKSM